MIKSICWKMSSFISEAVKSTQKPGICVKMAYTPDGKSRHLWPISSIKRLFWNQNLKMIPSEYRDITYLILKVLNRSLKWGTVGLWTPTGWKNTSRQSWTFEKNLSFSITPPKVVTFYNVQRAWLKHLACHAYFSF